MLKWIFQFFYTEHILLLEPAPLRVCIAIYFKMWFVLDGKQVSTTVHLALTPAVWRGLGPALS